MNPEKIARFNPRKSAAPALLGEDSERETARGNRNVPEYAAVALPAARPALR